jgi:hypothetical protein
MPKPESTLPQPPPQWRVVQEYPDLIEGWNKQYRLGIAPELIRRFRIETADLNPTGARIYLSGSLYYNWRIASSILKKELGILDYTLKSYVCPQDIGFLDTPFYAQRCQKPTLSTTRLDLGTYNKGIFPGDVRRERGWAGLEVLWTVALNLPMFISMNGNGVIPNLCINGLRCEAAFVPCMWVDTAAKQLVISLHYDLGDKGHYDAFYPWDKTAIVACM